MNLDIHFLLIYRDPLKLLESYFGHFNTLFTLIDKRLNDQQFFFSKKLIESTQNGKLIFESIDISYYHKIIQQSNIRNLHLNEFYELTRCSSNFLNMIEENVQIKLNLSDRDNDKLISKVNARPEKDGLFLAILIKDVFLTRSLAHVYD